MGYIDRRRNMATEEVRTAKEACCKCEKHKYRDRESSEYKKLLTRLNRIEGQIRGIRAMLEEDRYCVDIVVQASAVGAALKGFQKELLSQHIRSCVVKDVREGHDEAVDELVQTLQKLLN